MSRQDLYRFEAIADLYYRRFGRLAPGKSESPITGRDSNDDENRAQFAKWRMAAHDGAFTDAIDWIIELEGRIAQLERDSE